MKAKIAQKRKMAEAKLAKMMEKDIIERKEKAQERAQKSKFKLVQRPKTKHKPLLLEESQIIKQGFDFPKSKKKPVIQTAYQVSAPLNMFQLLLQIIQL